MEPILSNPSPTETTKMDEVRHAPTHWVFRLYRRRTADRLGKTWNFCSTDAAGYILTGDGTLIDEGRFLPSYWGPACAKTDVYGD